MLMMKNTPGLESRSETMINNKEKVEVENELQIINE